MSKIHMAVPLVEMDGDEMTRIIWKEIKERLILPYVDLKTEYYDLGLKHRDDTDDDVTIQAANATLKYGVAVKCATITPNAQRVEEYGLKKQWKSPNGTIRTMLDGTIFRVPIMINSVQPTVRTWKRPITIARHAYGDIYKDVEMSIPTAGTLTLRFEPVDKEAFISQEEIVFEYKEAGVTLAMYNVTRSIINFAHACFKYALETKQGLWFSTKDTISKQYDQTFKRIFEEIFEREYRAKFEKAGISYFYTLTDDAVARVVRSEGGFIWACKNYDGDVMADMVASAFGSLAMMTSTLVSPKGVYEYEAAHGTVTRHYYQYLEGKKTSTNPMATIFAWGGALYKRGELDRIPELQAFAERLQSASIATIEAGKMTNDIFSISNIPKKISLSTEEFINEIAARMSL